MYYTTTSVGLTVKILEIFTLQKNYEKQNIQPLLGYESIYKEQTMRVKELKLLSPLLTWFVLYK